MPVKTKTPQSQTPNENQGRDNFMTPNYAVDLLAPFIPKNVYNIWESAAGTRKIANRLQYHGYNVWATDINTDTINVQYFNFVTGECDDDISELSDCIITNPPFSLKQSFYEICRDRKIPFALLIPADYSQWVINACRSDGCVKIIPERRIDYLTPNILQRINDELFVFPAIKQYSLAHYEKLKDVPLSLLEDYRKRDYVYDKFYQSVDDVPVKIIRKFSSSDFHSLWLTWGFVDNMNGNRTEIYVDLSNEQKDNI